MGCISLSPIARGALTQVPHRCQSLQCCTQLRVPLAVGEDRVHPPGLCPPRQLYCIGMHPHRAHCIVWGCIPLTSLSGTTFSFISHTSLGILLPSPPPLPHSPGMAKIALPGRDPSQPEGAEWEETTGKRWTQTPGSCSCPASRDQARKAKQILPSLLTSHLQPTPCQHPLSLP